MQIAALDLAAPARAVRRGDVAGARRAERGLRIVDVLCIALTLLVIGSLGRIPVFDVGTQDAPFILNDVLLAGTLGLGALAALRNRRLALDGVATLALVFAAVGAISAFLAGPKFGLGPFEIAFSLAYLIRWLAYFGLYLLVINFVRRADVSAVWRVLERTILVFAAFGIFQSFFLPGFAQIIFPDHGYDVQGRRLVSTFLDPNFAGGLLVIGLLVLLARMAFGGKVPVWKPVLLFAALVLTVSRSSFVALFAGGMLLVLVRGHSRRLLGLGAVLMVLVLPFVPLILSFANSFGRFSTGGSATIRIISWLRALEIFLDNPVLGIGFNTYGFVQDFYGSGQVYTSALDGGLLFIAVMTGLAGVMLYSGMCLLVLARCRRIWRDRKVRGEDRGLALGVAASTVALLVHSAFINSLLYPFLMEVLWVLWGLVFLLWRGRGDGEQVTSPQTHSADAPVLLAFGTRG